MRPEVVTVSPQDRLIALISKFIDHPGSALFVVDAEEGLRGVVTAEQIRPVMRDPAALASLIIAEDVMVEGQFPRVAPDDSLAEVMRLLGSYRGELPVIEDGRIVGVIWPQDVINRYNTEVFKRDMAGGMASAVSWEAAGEVELVPAARAAVVAEVAVPPGFIGKSIGELDIRGSFGASVLMVKQMQSDGSERLETAPGPDYMFKDDDVMLVLGLSEEIAYLRRGVPRSRR